MREKKGLKSHCSHEKSDQTSWKPKHNLFAFLLSLAAPLHFHEVLQGVQQYYRMRGGMKHPSITFWVKTIGRNTILQARRKERKKTAHTKWSHKSGLAWINRWLLWHSGGSRKTRKFQVSKLALDLQWRRFKMEEIFTVTNGDRKTQRHGRFVKAVADWSSVLS